ncbi:phenylacetate-CoA oxygenase subunit PaaI [Actinoplanes sp. ATCC 53533]|uniref:1,2-phenylacetyl-CoA epoxidase subunit PaaC n=1 Tax=Actinoplanes sp. ATCC 53533 TaxID=1288362 RepID=UPI000F7A8EF4|nr:1,2-phenylacetyl-CoA epoxidase subunit PaaC [Actinoplanes sp. ATCC 53533]RSM65542.1 phenylacetate-CoA oxygenase subunit PaaI [Actinoplanes sp. ATCC 53533]
MSFDDAYEALTDHDDDARWAYGTGFTDPLAGVESAVPPGVDRGDLTAYCLALGDDALIMSHRLQQWVTRAPELEDELALANIALDLLGQARLLLSRAAEVEDAGRDEDALAYLRDAAEFRNVRLVERADADFAHLVARLLVFATWRLALLDRLSASADPVLAAIGAKGVKEVTYHRDYAARWVVRLGDGTEVSHARMQAAIDAVTPLIDELFRPDQTELRLSVRPVAGGAAGPAAGPFAGSVEGSVAGLAAGPFAGSAAGPVAGPVAVDPSTLRAEFDAVWSQVLEAATLRASGAGATEAADGAALAGGGRDGLHTAELTGILAELQGVARSLPGGVW